MIQRSGATMAVRSSYKKIAYLSLAEGKAKRKFFTWEEAPATFEALRLGSAETRAVEEGRLESMRWAIQLLLRKRFGIEPGALGDRLEAIDDPKELDALFEKLVDARSLDEIELAFRAAAGESTDDEAPGGR